MFILLSMFWFSQGMTEMIHSTIINFRQTSYPLTAASDLIRWKLSHVQVAISGCKSAGEAYVYASVISFSDDRWRLL